MEENENPEEEQKLKDLQEEINKIEEKLPVQETPPSSVAKETPYSSPPPTSSVEEEVPEPVTPQPGAPESSPTEAEKKEFFDGGLGKGKSKVVFWLAIFFFALSLIGLGAYFVGAFKEGRVGKKPSPQPTPLVANPLPTTTVAPTPTSENISDWETYTSSYFEIKYPGSFKIHEEDHVLSLSKWGPTQTEDTELFDGISLTFSVKDSLGKTLNSYVEDKIDETNASGLSEVIAGPKTITVNTYSGLTYMEKGLGTFEVIVLPSEDGNFFIEITKLVADPGGLGFSETADLILSTFKFISETPATATPLSTP